MNTAEVPEISRKTLRNIIKASGLTHTQIVKKIGMRNTKYFRNMVYGPTPLSKPFISKILKHLPFDATMIDESE